MDKRTLFACLLLALALLEATQCQPLVEAQSTAPTAPPTLTTTTTTTPTAAKEDIVDKGAAETPKKKTSLALPPMKLSMDDFASYDASGSSITLIVSVRDYGPRSFPVLVQKLAALSEQSQVAMVKPLQILLVHIGSLELIQHDVLERMAQLFSSKLQFITTEPGMGSNRLSVALNRAATLATGDLLLFASDMLEDITIASILQLAKISHHPSIGIVGPKLVDASKGGSTIFSAGINFVLGKNPHRPAWTAWNSDVGSTQSVLGSKTDAPFLVHRYQGYLEGDSRVKKLAFVHGVSKHCFMISKAHWDELRGFDATLDQTYLDVDLSFRSRTLFDKQTLYAPSISVSVTGVDALPDDSLTGDFVSNEVLKNDNKRFLEKWVEPLDETLKSGWKVKNMTLVWSMDCGIGQVLGFTTEAVNIIMELQHLIRVKVINEGSNCRAELVKAGFPDVVVKTIDILAHRDDKETIVTDHLAVVMHKDPRRFDTTYIYNPPDLLIGRSMFETDSIPSDWVEPTTSVDFLWVPSRFNVRTFSAGGVNASKLEVVPETIDLLHFDPSAVKEHSGSASVASTTLTTTTTSPERLTKPAKFNFLSVFKWEARKAWDTLVTAFFDEFSDSIDTEQVHLYIRSNMAADNHRQFNEFVDRYIAAKGITRDKLPKVILMDRFVPYIKLPAMYKAAQAFVTATHGEGWGLPIMEAMAMSLPVITTNWSGITEFTNAHTALLLDAKLVNSPIHNHQWAQVDLADLRAAMRTLYSQPKLAQDLGQAARKHLLDHFSGASTAKMIIDKIAAQIPHFAALKAARPIPSFGYSRTRHNSASNAGIWQGNNYGSGILAPGATATTTANANSWGAGNVVQKLGRTLTKAKMAD